MPKEAAASDITATAVSSPVTKSYKEAAKYTASSPKPLPSPTKGREFKAKGRSGAPNYSKDDVSTMLDIIERIEPIGANMWAMVADEFKKWCTQNCRPLRDQDSLKNKFDKLCNAKKPTGDPTCPPDVLSAKHIAQNIQGTIAAKLVDDDSDNDDDAEHPSGKDEDVGVAEIGARERKHLIGMTGVHGKKQKVEDTLVCSMEAMTEFMGVIAKSVSTTQDGERATIDHEHFISNAVKKEVTALTEDVNRSILDTKAMISALSTTLHDLAGKLSSSVAPEHQQ